MGSICSSNDANATTVEKDPGADVQPAPEEPATSPPEEPEAPAPTQATDEKATIKVFGCRGLRNADWSFLGSKSDAYVICKQKLGEAGDADAAKELFTTKTIPNCLEPIFDEAFEVALTPDATLEFSVYDKDPLKSDDFLGHAELKVADLANGFNGELELSDAGKNIKAYIKLLVKKEGSDYPAGPPPTFQITIAKEEKDLGLKFDKASPDALFVISLGDGAVKEYNQTVSLDEQVKPGQYITSVNDIKGSSKEMATEIAKPGKLVLSMARPQCFTIAIKKEGPLGLTLTQSSTANIIDAIQEGPVQEWNNTYPEKEVKAGDRILAVNGDRETLGGEQMKLIKKDGPMQIVISRRCSPQTSDAEKSFWDWF